MPIPTPSLLDWGQIIQRVFDEPNGRIRTDVVYSPNPGSIEVIINQATDNIAIGDGTTLFTGTTVGSHHGLDVNVLNNNVTPNTIPYINNLAISVANTEYSFNVPDGTILLMVKSRFGTLSIAYSSGGQTFNASPRSVHTVENINTSGITMYFQSSMPNDVVEIEGWHV